MICFSRPFTGVTPVCIAATNPLNWHSCLRPDFSHSLGLLRLKMKPHCLFVGQAANACLAELSRSGANVLAFCIPCSPPQGIAEDEQELANRLSRFLKAELEQPASTWTRISCSSTLESINFSAFNRFRLKAG